ncbi:MAG: hypothetical protein EXS64_18185 [Candidatus Latescibacteria bacterium]|nr:hypothetical protein [Candidatus Latescibacterota bacterium]
MHSALWMFAWDLRDEGVEKVLDFAQDLGLKAVNIASSYHAGRFTLPHNPVNRVTMPEDGVAYFHPQMDLYQETKLKPVVGTVSREVDWFDRAGKHLQKIGLRLVAWTICAHNTRLGLLHPDCVVRNAFGDPYSHGLCPANEEVRTYLKALVRDLATHYGMYAVQLESPGYMGFSHGHHHERSGVVFTPFEEQLMSLCFCDACLQRAEGTGLDARKVQASVREHLDDLFRQSPFRSKGRPTSMAGMIDRHPDLEKFLAFRKSVEQSLIEEIQAGIRDTGCKLFLISFGTPSSELVRVVDAMEIIVYHKKPAEAFALVGQAKGVTGESCALHAGIRVGFEGVSGPGDLGDIVASVKAAGGDGVLFYNYSEAPMRALRWIKTALAGVE